jgi:hypothetical protein
VVAYFGQSPGLAYFGASSSRGAMSRSGNRLNCSGARGDRPHGYVGHANRVWCPHVNVSSFANLMHLPLWAHRTLRAIGRLSHSSTRSASR